MSMQAQAERERQARVILGDSERQVAEKFGEAAKTYTNSFFDSLTLTFVAHDHLAGLFGTAIYLCMGAPDFGNNLAIRR